MNIKTMLAAEKSAKEFLKSVNAAKLRFETDSQIFQETKETGDVKRKSSDLTYRLAEFRKAS